MSDPLYTSFVARPGPIPRSVRTADGQVLRVPDDWELLAPGDAGLTRKVKAAGPTWTVKEKRGRREFSQGLWAPASTIERCREEVEGTRSTPAYQRRLDADRSRRQRRHEEYAAEFEAQVRDFLDFHPRHVDLARLLAQRVAAHATPVGSGTVARTERIPVEQRAEAAVIAWLRHQTTAYDRMAIRRVKGRRREVRRELARASRELLRQYRVDAEAPRPCLLERALDSEADASAAAPSSAPSVDSVAPPFAAASTAAPEPPSSSPSAAESVAEDDARKSASSPRRSSARPCSGRTSIKTASETSSSPPRPGACRRAASMAGTARRSGSERRPTGAPRARSRRRSSAGASPSVTPTRTGSSSSSSAARGWGSGARSWASR